MIKIAIISPNFTEDRFRLRWKELVSVHADVDIYLLIPNNRLIGNRKEYTFGTTRKDSGIEFDDERFHGRIFSLKYHKWISWTSNDLNGILGEIQPDFIYYIGLHNQESIVQIIRGKKKYFKESKLVLFSMRGPQHCLIKAGDINFIKRCIKNVIYSYEKWKQRFIYANCDAICCHYPEAKALFEKEGFEKPIYIQTQIGVNGERYKKNEQFRMDIRSQYGIDKDEFLFGSAIRFAPEKGVGDILAAVEAVECKLLLMGAGNQAEEAFVDKYIKEHNLGEKVIRTGMVLGDDMARYWNAVDCAIHVPQSTKSWVETFSLAVVQAMSTGIPVIGSDSGSVPYQIGFDELIIPERNVNALSQKMKWIMSDEERYKELCNRVYARTNSQFDIRVLNEEMYQIIKSICCCE